MNKKIVILVVAVVVVIAVVLGVLLFQKGSNKVEIVELNLQELNTSISEIAPFNEMPTMEVDPDLLSAVFGITEDEYEEFIGKVPMMNVQASMYLIVKAKEGCLDSVKDKVNKYAENQEQIWSTYLPEQYELVKQRKFNVVGDYVYLVISESATQIEELINK